VRPAAAAGAALACLAWTPILTAQQVTLRAGGFHTTYADTITGSAISLGGEAAWSGLLGRLTLGASVSQFSQGSRAAQLYGTGVRLLSLDPSRGVGITGDGILYALQDGIWAGRATGGVFGITTVGPLLAIATASVGGVHRVDDTGDPLLAGSLRLRADGDAWSLEGSVEGLHAGAIRYTDVGGGLRVLRGPVSLEAVGGVRLGNLGTTRWGQVHAEWQVTPALSIEASLGRYAPDVTGFLQGTFISAGVRLAFGAPMRLTARGLPASSAMAVRRDRDGVSVEFRLPPSQRVAIAGEWNGWEPQPLAAAGEGRWRVRLRLAPGVYRFTLVDESGHWFVPAGVPSMPDDFGGSAGLLVIRG
jgi:hypothetical protein